MITTQQLQLLKEGNKNAFEALYRAYNARIYSFVLSMIGDAGVAKDITQDIFLQIWEKRLNIDLEGNLGGYLFKISQNMVYHYVRRELLLQNYVDKLSNESADESVEIDEELDYLFLEEYIRFFVKFGGNLFFISTVFFFLNPIKSCRYVCFLVTLKTPHH